MSLSFPESTNTDEKLLHIFHLFLIPNVYYYICFLSTTELLLVLETKPKTYRIEDNIFI